VMPALSVPVVLTVCAAVGVGERASRKMYSFEAGWKREKNSSRTHAIFLFAGAFQVDKNFRNAYLTLVLLVCCNGGCY
jgi:hypothetical protein